MPSPGSIRAASQTTVGDKTLFIGDQPPTLGLFVAWINSDLWARFFSFSISGQEATLYAMEIKCQNDCMAVFLDQLKTTIFATTFSPSNMQNKDKSEFKLEHSVNQVRALFENWDS